MTAPLQLTFHGIAPSESITKHVDVGLARLEKICGRLTRCRVVFESAQGYWHHGLAFQIRIEVGVPGGYIFVTNIYETNASAAMHAAFADAERHLREHVGHEHGAHALRRHDDGL